MRKSGPALTLLFDKISVDIVPVFEFTHELPIPYVPRCATHIEHTVIMPNSLVAPDKLLILSEQSWFIVPKPLENRGLEGFWRFSFYNYEKKIMENCRKTKQAIKLVKV
jgi:hypothetical protein